MRTATALLVGIALATSVGTPARANCGMPSIYNQSPINGGTYTYITSPGRYDLDGAFWELGNSIGPYRVGSDKFRFENWHRTYEGKHYIAGDWSDSRIYRCVHARCAHLESGNPRPAKMVVGVWDQSRDGLQGYFGIMCVQEIHRFWDFDFTDIGGDLQLVEIPSPKVIASSRLGSTVQIRARVEPLAAGTQTDGNCPANLATGYRLFYQSSPIGKAGPSDRDRSAGWIAGDSAPVGHSVTAALACPSDCVVHVAAALILDGVETGVVGKQVALSIDEDAPGEDSDFDGEPNLHDNCTLAFNPEQHDVDLDGEGDVCDLDDGNILILFSSPDSIEWQAEQGFETWNVYEGDLSFLKRYGIYTQEPGSNPLVQQRCGETSTFVSAAGDPPVGQVAFVLVTGVHDHVEGSLGRDSHGFPRPNYNRCP